MQNFLADTENSQSTLRSRPTSWLKREDFGTADGRLAFGRLLASQSSHLKCFMIHLRMPLRQPPKPSVLQDSRFLFRQIRRVNGYTHPHRMEQTVGTGRVMLDDSGYSAYLHGFRRAARCCCGFGAEAARELGTQSLRSGGDTYLHAMGVSAEERRDVGQWATPLVERGYLRRTLKDSKLEFPGTKFTTTSSSPALVRCAMDRSRAMNPRLPSGLASGTVRT